MQLGCSFRSWSSFFSCPVFSRLFFLSPSAVESSTSAGSRFDPSWHYFASFQVSLELFFFLVSFFKPPDSSTSPSWLVRDHKFELIHSRPKSTLTWQRFVLFLVQVDWFKIQIQMIKLQIIPTSISKTPIDLACAIEPESSGATARPTCGGASLKLKKKPKGEAMG